MLLAKQRCLHEFGSVALFAVLIRWVVSLHPYSGHGKPPMYGDFEAQRHWMEITYNLPVEEWYHNSSLNDLNYWGLDYPPLTAYHSWVCGFFSHWLNPPWVALPESRGHESEDHKLFMRTTVILADLLIYFPAIFALVYQRRTVHGGFPYIIRICAEACVSLLAPPLILIDHGHFQSWLEGSFTALKRMESGHRGFASFGDFVTNFSFLEVSSFLAYNCISLGLTAWAIFAINKRKDVAAAVLFSLALNYKQMSLYLAFPFFFYLLGRCRELPVQKGLLKLSAIGLAVIVTFAVCWLPFLWSKRDAAQVLHRTFPFARGIFEDKVANLWCALNVVIKLKSWNLGFLASISTVLTLSSCMFSCGDIFWKPNDHKFKYCLVNCGLLFFLLSFQVHEKGILLAALPATLLLSDDGLACTWFLAASAFSMFPLLLKDGLAIPCYATVLLFVTLSHTLIDWRPKAPEDRNMDETADLQYSLLTALVAQTMFTGIHMRFLCPQPWYPCVISCLLLHMSPLLADVYLYTFTVVQGMVFSLAGFILLCLACQFAPVPTRLPDLWPLLLSIYACGHFVLFAAYFHMRQFNAHPVLLTFRGKSVKAD